MSIDSLALLSCRSPFLDDSKIYTPMGNLTLKSYVNEHLPSVDVKLMDDEYNLEDLSNLKDFQAVGISVMTPQRTEADKLARAIREHFPGKTLIMGGPHVTHYFQEAMSNPNFDFVVPGDGEKNLLAILDGRAKDKVVMFGGLSKQEVLDQPRPDRTSENAKAVLSRYSYQFWGREATTVMTARGCPERCGFCEDSRTNIRWSSYESINAQLDDIVALGYEGIYIFDDLWAIAMPKIGPICDAIKERGLVFRCNGQVRYFCKEKDAFAKLLGDAGCLEIAFGHESGNQTILDSVEKRTTVEQNYLSVQYAKAHGIHVKSFLMIGLPGETPETIADTEKFIATSGIDDFQLSIYYPYKGTRIRGDMDAGRDIDLTFEGEGLGAYGQKGGSTESVVRTKALSSQDLLRIRDELVRKYKPESHAQKWKAPTEDNFFNTHLKSPVEPMNCNRPEAL